MEKFNWSIDRMTILGYCNLEDFESFLHRKLSDCEIEPKNAGYNILELETRENIGYMQKPRFRQELVRFEFNPNLLLGGDLVRIHKMIHELLTEPRYSRLDFACDMINFGTDELYQNSDVLKAISYNPHYNPSRVLETKYWGKRSSMLYIRLYNKKVEQEEKQKQGKETLYSVDEMAEIKTLWRLEFELKRDEGTVKWQENVSEILDVMVFPEVFEESYKELSVTDRVLIKAWFEWPEMFSSLTRQQRRTLKAKIATYEPVKYDVKDELMKSFKAQEDKLKKQLAGMLDMLGIDYESYLFEEKERLAKKKAQRIERARQAKEERKKTTQSRMLAEGIAKNKLLTDLHNQIDNLIIAKKGQKSNGKLRELA